jgi:transglutaminase-like putative cysteine protease
MVRASRELLLTALTAATVLIAVSSWSRIVLGMSHAMAPIALTGAIVVVAGTCLRLAGSPRWVTALVQLALAWSVVSIRLTGTPIPVTHERRLRLEDAFLAAGDAAAHAAPPVPVIGGVLAFVLCGAALAFVVADLFARTLRMPALGGLVLLAVLAVPISVMGSQSGITGAARSGVSPWLFALVAAGWLAQVVIGQGDQLDRWGRQLDADDAASVPAAATSRSLLGTVAVGGTATALALVVPLAIPTLHLEFGGVGNGPGGDGRVTVTNPMVDVRRNLVQGDDVPLVQVHTDDPDPSYLRIAVLTRFSSTQWSAGDRSIPKIQDSHGEVPIAGLDSRTPFSRYSYTISVQNAFASRWLPTPAPIDTIDAAGDWRYDRSTEDFVAVPKDLTTAGLTYTAERVQPELDAVGLDDMNAGNGQVPATYTDVPSDLPKIVGTLAEQVTRRASTPFEQAVALQDWFRNSGNFTYSTTVDIGSGGEDLARFLGTGDGSRVGYCQQFAAAMAAMARTLGIPARVAVGFLNPTRSFDGSYVYSSHDMHAWPELYFVGAGWVRFEPTPAAAGTVIPAYAHSPAPIEQLPSTAPSASTSAAPNAALTNKPRPETNDSPTRDTATIPLQQHHVLRWVALGLVVALLGAGLAMPAMVRRRRRRTRMGGTAEDAWTEMRDTVIDLGIPWAEGVSPRATRKLLDCYIGTHEGYVALDRLVDAVERERYAATSVPLDRQTLLDVIEGLRQGEPPTAVRRAAWWPRSVVRRRRDAAAVDRTVDRVG